MTKQLATLYVNFVTKQTQKNKLYSSCSTIDPLAFKGQNGSV